VNVEAARADETSRMGDYVVLKRVAIGGMAEIFLARREGMGGFDRLVVLKRILPEYAHNEEFVRMFLNEARIAATLHHSNIVQVHGIGEERGQVFFAMEFLHGEDLSRVLSRANQIGRPPQLDGVMTIASAVCAGLHYAHERTGPDGQSLGIVHRDVSPHNVFVTYDGSIKLLDFGIAKATTSFGKTRTGVLKGKVAYMSPEQAYSQPVDRRSDIFCMGILLWELTTGRRLYRRRSELETLKALVDADAPRPSSVVSSYPPELEAIVMKCLSREREGRFATCDELSQALERFAANQGLQVSPLIATRMMRSLFKAEIAAFETAVKSGANLVDQVLARMEATAKKASIDDWDSDVASIIVDEDSDKTALTPPPVPENGPTELDAPIVPAIAAPVANPRPLPGLPPSRPSAPMPVPSVVVEASRPRLEMPPQRPVERSRNDMTLRLPSRSDAEQQRKPRTSRTLWIVAGVAIAAIALAIVAVKRGGDSKPDQTELAASEPPRVAPKLDEPTSDLPQEPGGDVKKPEPKPEPTIKKPEPEKPVEARKPVEVKKPEPKKAELKKPEPKKAELRKPEPKKPVEARKPEPKKPTTKDLDGLPETKKPEPRKPEPKKPTPKDLDSLPL
jgi:serine/threonine protein kinase